MGWNTAGRKINPQNNLPEPMGTIVLLANFFAGVWNVYSNMRQEEKQTIYDKRQKEIITMLQGIREEMRGGEKSEGSDRTEQGKAPG